MNEHGLDTLLARERYQRLHGLLASGKMKVRVIPRDGDNVFVHGKAGVVERADGREHAFVGSLNDSASGLRHAYEILWADDDPAAAAWVREEFEHFWVRGIDLPDWRLRSGPRACSQHPRGPQSFWGDCSLDTNVQIRSVDR